jgi:hypothetical protein
MLCIWSPKSGFLYEEKQFHTPYLPSTFQLQLQLLVDIVRLLLSPSSISTFDLQFPPLYDIVQLLESNLYDIPANDVPLSLHVNTFWDQPTPKNDKPDLSAIPKQKTRKNKWNKNKNQKPIYLPHFLKKVLKFQPTHTWAYIINPHIKGTII